MSKRNRRFHRNQKISKNKRRLRNKSAMQIPKITRKVLNAKQHVINLSRNFLQDSDYLLLSRGLKYIPNPKRNDAKNELLNSFDEMARKMRCRYLYSNNETEIIHPFYMKTGFNPHFSCHTLENYFSLTKLELSYLPIRKFADNISKSERNSLKHLKNNKNIVIKKADKNGNVVILDKDNYLREGYRQLNMPHYQQIQNHNLKVLQRQLLRHIKNMEVRGILDEQTFRFLWDGINNDVRPGRIYFLPKIHKLNKQSVDEIISTGYNKNEIIPPGRPIISQSGSFLESIGRYVNRFLNPITMEQKSMIKDTISFIRIIENLKPKQDCLIITYDVTNMFTNCPIDELLSAVKEAYNRFDKAKYDLISPPTDDLIFLLRCILENNIFEFDGKLFKQVIGTAIGAVPSPEICDILMFQIFENILSLFESREKIYYAGRYRDDGFILYHGTKSEDEALFEIANSYHQYIKFTFEISSTHTNFLDVHIYKGDRFALHGTLDVKTYFKPTNSFMYLERSSCHSKNVFSSFIRAEALRNIRTTSNSLELNSIIENFKQKLKNRGYSKEEIDFNIDAVMSQNRNDVIINTKKDRNKDKIPLVLILKYNPRLKRVKKTILKYWDLLSFDETCANLFKDKPMIAYKKHKNIGEYLTSAKLK